MPKGWKRYFGRGDLHFLTFSCYQRLPLLGTVRARNLFLRALGKIRERYEFLLVGYVVMPNHVHLLISESPKATPSVVLKVLKQRVSRDRHPTPGYKTGPPRVSSTSIGRRIWGLALCWKEQTLPKGGRVRK
jgi:putative transposase